MDSVRLLPLFPVPLGFRLPCADQSPPGLCFSKINSTAREKLDKYVEISFDDHKNFLGRSQNFTYFTFFPVFTNIINIFKYFSLSNKIISRNISCKWFQWYFTYFIWYLSISLCEIFWVYFVTQFLWYIGSCFIIYHMMFTIEFYQKKICFFLWFIFTGRYMTMFFNYFQKYF